MSSRPYSKCPQSHGDTHYKILQSSRYLPTSDLGPHTTKLVIGRGHRAKDFTIHRRLLEQETPALHPQLFQERCRDNTIHLPDGCPIAFTLILHYLYTGRVWERNAYPPLRTGDQIFWFRAYKLAVTLEMVELPQLIFRVMGSELWGREGRFKLPSTGLLQILFNGDEQQEGRRGEFGHVRELVVDATAYRFVERCKSLRSATWTERFEENQAFAAAVMVRVVQLKANDYDGYTGCPYFDPKYDRYLGYEEEEGGEFDTDMDDCDGDSTVGGSVSSSD